jgi:hypothetical protein
VQAADDGAEAVPAAEVGGELRLAVRLGRRQLRALERDEAVELQRADARQRRFDVPATANETIGRSSERVSRRSVRRACLAPKPSTPRSTRLVSSSWRP